MSEVDLGVPRVAATVAATDEGPARPIEIVSDRRRTHDAAFRAEVVSQSFRPGARVTEIAQRFGLCTSLVHRWRRGARPQAAPAAAVHLVPVRMAQPQPECAPPTTTPRPSGMIEIELAGGVRVRVGSDVNQATLRRVIAALRG